MTDEDGANEEIVETKPDEVQVEVERQVETGFEPKIIGFLCNWCSYAGADLCGVSRFQYPTNIRIIRVMCSTRVDPTIVLEMFIQGADGVLIGGCHIGDCHYISGNYHTERKIKLTKKLLKEAGIDPARLRLEWISASEGERFSKVITEFTNEIKGIGQSTLAGENPDIEKLESVYAARNVVNDFRLRALVGRELSLTEEGNVYNNKIDQTELDELYDNILQDEFLRHRILQLTKNRPLSIKDISKYVDYSPQTILRQIVTLKDRGLISVDRIDGTSPLYISGKEEIVEIESGFDGGS
jgi:coenzyme F420-reducing hydrogenase delta subunit/predicted transcriptional regulator